MVAYAASNVATPTDTVQITDRPATSRPASDTVSLSASAAPNGKNVTDTVPLFASAAPNGRTATETVPLDDSPSLDSAPRDVVALSDSPSVQANIFYAVVATDTVDIVDDMSPDSTASDIVAIADDASPESAVMDIVAMADSVILQPNIFYAITASDIVAISDVAALFSSVIDAVALSDSAELTPNVFYPLEASDIVAIAEAASLFSTALDAVGLAETASIPLSSVTDVVDIIVSSSIITTKSIIDQLAVSESFFDIAVTFNRGFSEMLVLPDCIFTNESGLCNRVGLANIVIGDLVDLLFSSSNSPVEQLTAADLPARSFAGGRGTAEAMQAVDQRAMSVTSPPPNATLPAITTAMTETMGTTGLSDPREAVAAGGTWDMDGLDNESLESLLVALGMPTYNTSTTASSAGAGEMTMALPTFLVEADVNGEQPEGGLFLTPTVSDVPAGMQVMIPIDTANSLDDDNDLDAGDNMTVTFTPAQDASNMTMMIAMLDDNPAQLGMPTPDIPGFFIDISFAGDFAANTPADPAYFEDFPRITFTVSEEWAEENNLRRQGGIPIIDLFLLDEATNSWERITDIDSPAAAEGGIYTYTATLPHFSTYMVRGDSIGDDSPGDDREHLINLAESLSVKSAASLDGAQESTGRTVIKDLDESLSLSASQPQPLHQRVITIHNVTVGVSVADVYAAGVGTAVAKLDFEITNKGASEQEIVIGYWYSSGGERLYEGEQVVTISGGESGRRTVDVPFGSAGVYEIMIEAIASDQTLASTDVVVEVPWLAANLYILVVIAAAVVAASIAYVIYAMRTRLVAGK